MNPGGVRADLTFASSLKGEGDGIVTYGEAFSVQPFNNIVTTNNFLADGGDGFQSLRAGTNRTSLSDFDVDSLVRYLEPTLTGAPIGPPPTNRITVVP
ncbi:MAG TPA: hypothetical protein VF066_01350 [Thermoleophilaceae bacterium]